MDLGHGRSPLGIRFEIGKHFLKGALQFGLHHAARLAKGERGHTVLQLAKFVDVCRREDIGAGAHQLPQFDEAGAEVFQGLPNAHRGRDSQRCGGDIGRGFVGFGRFAENACRDICHSVFDHYPGNG